jgi:hypothetical protein
VHNAVGRCGDDEAVKGRDESVIKGLRGLGYVSVAIDTYLLCGQIVGKAQVRIILRIDISLSSLFP